MQIRANGPMSVAEYMALCLSHPRHGYYRSGATARRRRRLRHRARDQPGLRRADRLLRRQPLAADAPAAELHAARARPRPRHADGGRAARREHAPRASSMRSTSSSSRAAPTFAPSRQTRLGEYHPYWAPEIDAVGDGPLFVVANEFFDALPIRQFVRTRRRLARAADRPARRQARLRSRPRADAADLGDGRMTARSARSRRPPPASMTRLARKVAAQGGAILAIDYGYEGPQIGETLQAVRGHAFADPLEAPGETDLSAHVDFGALRQAATAAGLTVAPLATQGDFLRRLGADERARRSRRRQSRPGGRPSRGHRAADRARPDGRPVQGLLRPQPRPQTRGVRMTAPFVTSACARRHPARLLRPRGRRLDRRVRLAQHLRSERRRPEPRREQPRASDSGDSVFAPDALVTLRQVHSTTVRRSHRAARPRRAPRGRRDGHQPSRASCSAS